jgi:hypothetical protein
MCIGSPAVKLGERKKEVPSQAFFDLAFSKI